MGDIQKVGSAQAAEKAKPQSAEDSTLNGVRNFRNAALGVAALGGAAMAAEAAGVLTLPATIPTGIIAVGALATAGAAHAALKLGEWMDSMTQQRDKALNATNR